MFERRGPYRSLVYLNDDPKIRSPVRFSIRSTKSLAVSALVPVSAGTIRAQRPASPRGEAAVQIEGQYEGNKYVGGKWLAVDYGRPILRGRNSIFGAGDSYGNKVNAGAPIWRAGANKATRFSTEADLKFGDKVLPAGEYSMFVDLEANNWTLIFSTYGAKDNFRDPGDGLWGAHDYTDAKDVLRVGMEVAALPVSYEQLTIAFVDVLKTGGSLAILWDKTVGSAKFSLQ